MGDNCKDCVQIQNIEDKIKSLWHVTNEIKNQNKDFEKRIVDLEITKGETREQLKSINDFLERIEKSISVISDELSGLRNQPIKNFEKLKWIIITALASSIVGAVIGFVLERKQ